MSRGVEASTRENIYYSVYYQTLLGIVSTAVNSASDARASQSGHYTTELGSGDVGNPAALWCSQGHYSGLGHRGLAAGTGTGGWGRTELA